MRLTKFTHACVQFEQKSERLLVDPGIWTEDEAFDGVSTVLITHEHPDHVDPERLALAAKANPALRVHTIDAVAALLSELGDAVVTIASGDTFTAAGFDIEVVGGAHAETYEGLPGCANVGYIVDGVYHPGDSLFVPSTRVSTLLLPVSGPWLKTAEMLDFVRAVAPERAFPIHDAIINDRGQHLVDNWVTMKGQTEYERLTPRTGVLLG